MAESIITLPFRLAFPEVFEPVASTEGGDKKYSITMLFPKEGSLISTMPGDAIMEVRKLAAQAIKEKWGEDKAKWPANLKGIDPKTSVSSTGKDGWPLRDGDLVEWDGFHDHVFVRASSKFKPGIVNAKLRPIMSEDDVYGGLICRAQINAYGYDSNGSKGVAFGLSNIQILKDDGTSFGSKQRAEDAFSSFGDAGDTGEDEPW